MRILRLITTVLMVAAAASMTTGCKKNKAKKGKGFDNIAGVVGSDVYDAPLGERPDDGYAEYGRGEYEVVYFAYDSSQIGASERMKLEAVAGGVRGSSGGIIIEGHCDERGSREYNLALGERRAQAVRAYLIGLGVEASRIQTKSLGEEQPASMGHDESSYTRNRRAEFVLYQ